MATESLSVSVIIPVLNGEAFLAEAVESIRAQGIKPLEIIIVDDGSTDGTAEVARSLGKGINYVYKKNGGVASARNKGLKMARGNIIAFLDADDLWSEKKLEQQLLRFTENPSLQIVMGFIQMMVRKKTLGSKIVFENFADPFMPFSLGSALYRKNVFSRVGVFDESMQMGEDVDWFMRAREQGVPMTIHKDTVMFNRVHGSNITMDKQTSNTYFMKVLKKSMDRRKVLGKGAVDSLGNISDLYEADRLTAKEGKG